MPYTYRQSTIFKDVLLTRVPYWKQPKYLSMGDCAKFQELVSCFC